MRVVLLALAACSATDTGDSGKAPAENTAPVVKFLEPRGTSFDVDEVITFEADVSDAEDSPDQLDFSWTAIDGTEYAVDSTPEPDGSVKRYMLRVDPSAYGGDASRKRKLLDKQKEGKKRMRQFGSVDIPQSAFIAALRMNDE